MIGLSPAQWAEVAIATLAWLFTSACALAAVGLLVGRAAGRCGEDR